MIYKKEITLKLFTDEEDLNYLCNSKAIDLIDDSFSQVLSKLLFEINADIKSLMKNSHKLLFIFDSLNIKDFNILCTNDELDIKSNTVFFDLIFDIKIEPDELYYERLNQFIENEFKTCLIDALSNDFDIINIEYLDESVDIDDKDQEILEYGLQLNWLK